MVGFAVRKTGSEAACIETSSQRPFLLTGSLSITHHFLGDAGQGLLAFGRLAEVVGEGAHDALAEEDRDLGWRETLDRERKERESSGLGRQGRDREERFCEAACARELRYPAIAKPEDVRSTRILQTSDHCALPSAPMAFADAVALVASGK